MKSNCEVTNIVATMDINREIALDKFTEFIKDKYVNDDDSTIQSVKYQDTPPVQIVLKTDDFTITIHKSGKLSGKGIGSISGLNDMKDVGNKITKESNLNPNEMDLEINNIVATDTIDYDSSINLMLLSEYLDDTVYEPSDFSGMEYKGLNGHITLYKNGKFIISGCSSFTEMNEMSEEFKNKIDELVK
jgi:TATA-box binding protein (TBP) (component of TFIID and TFIIIB)